MRRMRMGMVGGGRDAFIGAVHRAAARLDGEIELVCGAFSRDPEKSRLSGSDLMLPPERVYGDYREMMQHEAALPEGERMDFVSIVTPNSSHHEIASAALDAGFHVVCDKPLTVSLDKALELEQRVRASGLLFALTHNYTGYPLVKHARQLIREGRLGEIRKIVVEYSQGWLASRIEDESKQAVWRTDPEIAGPVGCMGDIGTHAENLLGYMTGLQVSELCADLTTFVGARRLDDDGNVLLRLSNGARAVLIASQISIGEENNLSIRIYGETAGIGWRQQEPNSLTMLWPDRPAETIRAGANNPLAPDAIRGSRLPAGHPEGFLEAFANIYSSFARHLRALQAGSEPAPEDTDYPGIEAGVRGMAFVDALLRSQSASSKWVTV